MLYAEFLKNHIARLNTQYTKPPMTLKEKFTLPFNSVYHTNEEGFGVFGAEDPVINNYKGDITVENKIGYALPETYGRIRKISVSIPSLIMTFNKNNKRFRTYAQSSTNLAKTPRILHVVNYGNMDEGITQLEEPMREYHQFLNYWYSVMTYMKAQVQSDNRYHFIKWDTPIVVPPKTLLNRVLEKDKLSITDIGNFIDATQLVYLHLWRFLCRTSDEAVALSFLSIFTPEELQRVHLLLDVGTRYVTINLGLLLHWIKTPENKKGFWTVEEVQNRTLKLLMNLADSRTNTTAAEEDLDDEIDKTNAMLAEVDNLAGENGETGEEGTPDIEPLSEEETQKAKVAEFEATTAKKNFGGFYKKPQLDLTSTQPNLSASVRDLIEQDNAMEFIADDTLEDPLPMTETDTVTEDELKSLEEVQEQVIKDRGVGEYKTYTPPATDLAQPVLQKAREMQGKGLLTSAELRRYEKLATAWENIEAPNGEKMVDYVKVDPKLIAVKNDVKIADPMHSVLDETFLYSSLKSMDKVYIEKILDRHIHAMTIGAFQREGIIVKDIKRTHVKTLMDDYYHYSVKIIPINGEESTIPMKIPRPTSDGTFMARGVKMRMRRQRGDLPIRKIAPGEVALTSYQRKMFVTRSERMTNNYDKWICKQIYAGTLSDPVTVTDLTYGSAFDPTKRLPRVYSGISQTYLSFNIGDQGQYHLDFDQSHFTPEIIAEHKIEKNECACGTIKGKPNTILVIDDLGIITAVKGNVRTPVGTLESLVGVSEETKRPVEMIDIGPISGVTLPLGVLLGYYLGLGNLLKTLDVPHRRVNKGQRLNLESNEFAIKFGDQTLVVKDTNPTNTQLINGFNRYKNEIAASSIWEFDKPAGYEKYFNGIWSARQQVSLDMVRTNWIDEITADLLRRGNYPTDIILLLIEAAKMLEFDDHEDENDITGSRAKGYERFAGLAHGEIMNALSDFNARRYSPRNKLTMNPEAVWYAITADQTTAPVDDSNPMQSIKDRSVVVFSGAGGRSGQTMTGKSRRYHKSGIGVISSDTVDSGDVATINYLTANPNFDTIYGTSGILEKPDENAAASWSESMLNVPGAKYDDPKRINFISIQNSSTTHCVGYELMPCRTGFEKTVAQRSGDMFSATASGNGVVEHLSKDVIRIKYEDGTIAAHQIGRRYGKWSGKVIPHSLKTDLKVGDSVKENDILFYNELFFTKDPFGDDVALKWGVLARVAFIENRETLEDGSGISADFAKKLTTTDCKPKYIQVNFDEEVRNLLPVGSKIDDESILCTIMPPSTAALSQFADDAADVLRRVKHDSPRGKFNGVIERYRVYYCGDISEMSPSLALLTEQSNDEILALARKLKEPAVDGMVPLGYRIDGHPIAKNTAIIEVSMLGELGMKPGDKVSIGGQMKSIVGETYGEMEYEGDQTVFEETPISEDGQPLDVIFAQTGSFNRMINSAQLSGGINTCMIHIGINMANIFFGDEG